LPFDFSTLSAASVTVPLNFTVIGSVPAATTRLPLTVVDSLLVSLPFWRSSSFSLSVSSGCFLPHQILYWFYFVHRVICFFQLLFSSFYLPVHFVCFQENPVCLWLLLLFSETLTVYIIQDSSLIILQVCFLISLKF